MRTKVIVLAAVILLAMFNPARSNAQNTNKAKLKAITQPSGCKDSVVVYFDRSGSMFERKAERTHFDEAVDVVESLFSQHKRSISLTLKTFGGEVDIDPSRESIQLDKDGRGEDLAAAVSKLNRKPDNQTDIAKVLADIMSSGNDREISVIISDFVHDTKADGPHVPTVEDWRKDVGKLEFNGKRGAGALQEFFDEKGKSRSLLLFGVGVDEVRKWEVQDRVRGDILAAAGRNAKSLPLDRLNLATGLGSLESALRPIAIEVDRQKDGFYLRMANKGCQDFVEVGDIVVECPGCSAIKQTLTLGRTGTTVPLPPNNISFSTPGSRKVYVLSQKKDSILSNEAHFSIDPSVELVGGAVRVSGGLATIDTLAKVQPIVAPFEIQVEADDEVKWSFTVGRENMGKVNSWNLDYVGRIIGSSVKGELNVEPGLICGEREAQVCLLAKNASGAPISRLKLRRSTPLEDRSHRFFESAAIPVAIIVVLVLIATFLRARARFSFLVENLHWITPVVFVIYAILHFVTRSVSSWEDWVAKTGNRASLFLVAFIALFVYTVLSRIRSSETLRDASGVHLMRKGQLVRRIKKAERLWQMLYIALALVGVLLMSCIMVSEKETYDCSYSSEGFVDAANAAAPAIKQ